MNPSLISSINKKIIALVVSIATFTLLLLLTAVLIFNYSIKLNDDKEYEVSLIYYDLIDEIQDFTNQNISLLSGFSAFVQTTDVFADDEVYSYLYYLLEDHLDDIKNVGIFKDTTIMWVYPIEGNESAIGVDFSKVPDQSESVIRVKDNLETLFLGPVNLVQGGTGFIIRMPLLKDDKYWGMTSIVLKAEQAFAFIENYRELYNVDYLITHRDRPDEIIFGNEKILSMSPLKFTTEDSLGGWDIYTVPKDGWQDYSVLFLAVFIFCVLIYFLISRSIYLWIINYNTVLNDKIELEKKYILDRFTGIYTREYFNLRVKEEFSHASRYNHSISMIYFDLDHFKNVNDTYGHSTGDKVLLSVVDVVKTIIRNEDIFSRWGGDEFILLLRQTDLTEALSISERIRSEIENLEISKSLGVTASLGCSQWKKSEYIESWFSRTDKALYNSKNNGKNMVTVSDHKIDKDILVRVKWDEKWNCGNPIIDEEHKDILDTCNCIIESSLSKKSFDESIRNIEFFLKQIELHFCDEMTILKKINYPYANEHARIHGDLLRRSKEVYYRMIHEEISSVELFIFLLNTVVDDHFRDEDVRYFEYI